MDTTTVKSSQEERYLQFSLGHESYAVHLLQVKEVIPTPETTKLPNSPKHFVGIMNLRGQIISIYDLRKKLGIQMDANAQTEEAVVIVNIEDTSIGLVVDSINKVINIQTENILQVPEIKSQVNAKYIEGVHRDSDHLTMILNLGTIFDIKEVKSLTQLAGG